MPSVDSSARRKRRPSRSLSAAELHQLHERTGISPAVTTEEAAALLGVTPQTMRRWACYGSGPIRPRRVAGRLRWPVTDIQAVLAGAPAESNTPSMSV